jgi:flagellin
MPFQVNSNVAALQVYNHLGVHQAKASASLARISSGLKSAGGGDVASTGTATTISANMQATQSSISQVQYQINLLQAADTAYGELIALGQKGVEVASRGPDSGADISALWSQLTAIVAGITSIQDNSQFNGALLTAARAPDVGANPLTVTPAFAAVDATGVAGLHVDGANAGAATAANIASTLGEFNTWITSTVDNRATNAGRIASLQNTLQVLNSVAANELSAISQVQDTDIATEMMSLTSANILTEAATAMLAQAMQLPNSVLQLLQ